MATLSALPIWDLDSIFPGVQSPEFAAEMERLGAELAALEREFDARQVGKRQEGSALSGAEFDAVVSLFEEFFERFSTVKSYLANVVSADSRNEAGLARQSELAGLEARLGKLRKRLTAWVGTSDIEALLASSEEAKSREFFVRRSKTMAGHQMEPELESLLSDLEVTGSVAWERMYDNLTSQLEGDVQIRGEATRLPISAIRSLAYDPDRETRAAAYRAEMVTWPKVEVPIAAAMNSIKGETLEVAKRRGWASPLDAALFSTHIDIAALDAMMEAAQSSFPDFRRYLRLKARALGIPRLAFYDLFASLPAQGGSWNYGEAERFVARQFGTYSPKMGEFAERAFRERWIDPASRPGKVDGAYCSRVRSGESRILMNFKPCFGSVSTLAHELGHGYHNVCLAGRTALQRGTPMTLGETASIFCETIVRRATLASGTAEEKLEVLEASLQGNCQVVVDIFSRFLFEQAVFERRKQRELSPAEMCSLMTQAQKDTYGDGLDPEALHPYMWAAKPHYYGTTFYNFPYMFGLLFGLGLYAVYRQEGEAFKSRYDDLLSSTGLADAATLGARFGIDIRSTAFWDASLDQIRSDIDQFEELLSQAPPAI